MTNHHPESPVAFIGAGSIGGPMAERLLERGRTLLICDAAEKTRDSFAALGCAVTDDPGDCAGCGTIIFMVANDDQLRSAAARLTPRLDGQSAPLLLVMSTVLPETVTGFAAQLSASGARILDAPVSGGSVKARAGDLSIMVGGEETVMDEARPLLDDLATSVFHCGPLGSGEATKILNNLVGVTNLFLFSETMQIAKSLGMDLQALVNVMEASSGRNAGTRDWPARRKLFAWNSASLDASRSVVGVTRKDLHHALKLARRSAAATPILEAVVAAHDTTLPETILERWSRLAADGDATDNGANTQ